MTNCLIPWPESNLQVLEYLHTYRFLTAGQFLRLEVASHIELRRFSERYAATVEFFHTYFDTSGANRNEDPAERL